MIDGRPYINVFVITEYWRMREQKSLGLFCSFFCEKKERGYLVATGSIG